MPPRYYLYEYQHMGRAYGGGLWALSWEHAERRLARLNLNKAYIEGIKIWSLYVWYINNIKPWGGWKW